MNEDKTAECAEASPIYKLVGRTTALSLPDVSSPYAECRARKDAPDPLGCALRGFSNECFWEIR